MSSPLVANPVDAATLADELARYRVIDPGRLASLLGRPALQNLTHTTGPAPPKCGACPTGSGKNSPDRRPHFDQTAGPGWRHPANRWRCLIHGLLCLQRRAKPVLLEAKLLLDNSEKQLASVRKRGVLLLRRTTFDVDLAGFELF